MAFEKVKCSKKTSIFIAFKKNVKTNCQLYVNFNSFKQFVIKYLVQYLNFEEYCRKLFHQRLKLPRRYLLLLLQHMTLNIRNFIHIHQNYKYIN